MALFATLSLWERAGVRVAKRHSKSSRVTMFAQPTPQKRSGLSMEKNR